MQSNDLCNKQLIHFEESFELNERKMRDAWGKTPSGMFSGNLYDFGNFDQCIEVKHYSENVGEISGQHCTLMIPFDRDSELHSKFMPPSRR